MTTAYAGGQRTSLLRYSAENLPPLSHDNGRLAWPDIAKGASITMVVYWHMVDDMLALNEALSLLRMPLFFFVAGLFIRSTFFTGNEHRFTHRVLNFLWLYVVWAFILFTLLYIPYNILSGFPVFKGFPTPYNLFIDPPPTLWFIYALGLAVVITMATRKIPFWIMLLVSAAGYLWSAVDQNLRDPPFFTRLVRLYPFFLLGLISLDMLNRAGSRLKGIWPLLLPVFCLMAYSIYFSDLRDDSWLTLLISLFGVISLVVTAQSIEGTMIGKALGWIGSGSLYIYLMHRIFWAYLGLPLMELGKQLHSQSFTIIAMSLLSVMTIAVCAWIGPIMARHEKLAFLFAMPAGLFRPKSVPPA